MKTFIKNKVKNSLIEFFNNNVKSFNKSEFQQEIIRLEKRLLLCESMINSVVDNISDLPKKYCPLCQSKFHVFYPGGVAKLRPNAMCPNCGSLERHRAVYLYLDGYTEIFKKQTKLLHFAPENTFYKIFSKLSNIDYLTVDLDSRSPLVMEKADIQLLKYEADSFDFIYCSHVLEHVPNDRIALKELYRVLKPGGTTLIQVPLRYDSQKTFEDPNITTKEDREKYFGQDDHVRYYGLDIMERLIEAGFKVEIINMADILGKEKSNEFGIVPKDYIYICSKSM